MSTTDIARYATLIDYKENVPITVVWELTLACNLNCRHCGSRAGKVRPNELSLDECFDIINQLKRLGTREIGIIGGEVFLKKNWIKIVEKITKEGIDCNMQTGGYNLSEEKILAAKDAGVKNIGLSIDGLLETHNYIRGKNKAFESAINCLSILQKHQISSSVNTTITSYNKNELEEMLDIFISLGVRNWQIQLAVAMGNAVDNNDLLIQPYEIKDILDGIALMYTKGLANNLLIQPANNLGYFGPHEHKWRAGNFGHYVGCSAGQTAIGIEADGTIKGCPSLPTKDYSGGNVRDMSIEDIWKNSEQISFTRSRDKSDLWGFCESCYYADVCLGGCTWASHVLFGKRGNNPFCYHRVSELEKQGKREKIMKVKEAEGQPFDRGLFEIIVEDFNGTIQEVQSSDNSPNIVNTNKRNRDVVQLHLCKGCNNYIYENTAICPFCTGDVDELESEYKVNFDKAKRSMDTLLKLL